MNKNLRKTASIALLSALAFISIYTVQPKPAHALVGLGSGSPAMIITGGVLSGLGGTALGWTAYTCNNQNCEGLGGALIMLFVGAPGGIVGATGLILLDGGAIEFGHLTFAQAAATGMNRSEWMSYEDELTEINAIFQDQLMDRQEEFERTGKVSIANSRASWEESSQALSPAAYSALKKLASKTLNSSVTKKGN